MRPVPEAVSRLKGRKPGETIGTVKNGIFGQNGRQGRKIRPALLLLTISALLFVGMQSRIAQRLPTRSPEELLTSFSDPVKFPPPEEKSLDGTCAILESGPDDTLYVYVLDVGPRLHTFEGVIQVRRCKVALTAEQSATLTRFALAQEGKRYAMWRLLLQGTPIKTRGGPLRLKLAKTHFDRQRWLCTEIVVAAAELVGLMDPHVIKATNTYPLDILDDHMYTLLPVYEEAAYWSPHP